MQAESLSQADTEFSADAVEFCPLNSRIFACGTYQVDKEDAPVPVLSGDDAEDAVSPTVTRRGRLLLYEIDEDGRNLCALDPRFI
jgi:diphthamide biosynthesis protein 7